MIDSRTRTIVGSVITFAWLIAMLVGLGTGDYHALDVATPIMFVFVSYLYGDAIIKKRFPNGIGGG